MVYNREEDRWRCAFDSIAAARALDFYTRLSAEKWTDRHGKTRRGYSSKGVKSNRILWERGQIGMRFAYVDEKLLSKINPETTGMAPVPLGPTGVRGSELNSRMMGLFAGIKHPAVRDAAWEYMRFYDSEEAVALKTKIMVESGMGQYMNPKYLKRFGYPEMDRLSPQGWLENFEIAIATGKPEPYGTNSNVAYNMMTIPIQKAEALMLRDQLPDDEDERLQVLHDLLVEANAEANEKMIGIIAPEERRQRRWLASIVLLTILLTFGLTFRYIAKIFATPAAFYRSRKPWDVTRYAWAYVLLLPAVLSIFVWSYIPLLRGSVMAFFDYQLVLDSTWRGVDNFGDLLFNGDWWITIWNGVRYCCLVIGLSFLPPIVLAVFLQEVPRCKMLFRLIYYLPAVISSIVVVVLWKQFFRAISLSSCGCRRAVFSSNCSFVQFIRCLELRAKSLHQPRALML